MTISPFIVAAGKTREQICREAGISRGFLSQLERGSRQIGVDRIEPLAAALGVSPADLRPDLASLFTPSSAPEGGN